MAEFLERSLTFQSLAFSRKALDKDQLDRQTGTGIFCASSSVVYRGAVVRIGRVSAVNGAIGTAKHICVVIGWLLWHSWLISQSAQQTGKRCFEVFILNRRSLLWTFQSTSGIAYFFGRVACK